MKRINFKAFWRSRAATIARANLTCAAPSVRDVGTCVLMLIADCCALGSLQRLQKPASAAPALLLHWLPQQASSASCGATCAPSRFPQL